MNDPHASREHVLIMMMRFEGGVQWTNEMAKGTNERYFEPLPFTAMPSLHMAKQHLHMRARTRVCVCVCLVQCVCICANCMCMCVHTCVHMLASVLMGAYLFCFLIQNSTEAIVTILKTLTPSNEDFFTVQ